MKRIKTLFAVASLLCFTACEPCGPNLNNFVVQDRQGQFYVLKHHSGDLYLVHALGTNVTWKVPQ